MAIFHINQHRRFHEAPDGNIDRLLTVSMVNSEDVTDGDANKIIKLKRGVYAEWIWSSMQGSPVRTCQPLF